MCESRVIVVLGAHRSGTSLLAQILSRLGVALGSDLVGANPFNEDGHWDHTEIVRLHEQLMEAMGRQWFRQGGSVPLPDGWLQRPEVRECRERLTEIVRAERSSAEGRPWGFKDPHTVRLLPLWHQVFESLEVNPLYVLALRSPSAVVRSLRRRDGLTPPLGALLWLTAVQEASMGVDDALVVDYDTWFGGEPDAQARLMSEGLALGADASTISQAVACARDDLRHYVEAGDDRSVACSALDFACELYSSLRNADSLGAAPAAFWTRIMAYREFADVFRAWPEHWEAMTDPPTLSTSDPGDIDSATEPVAMPTACGDRSTALRAEEIRGHPWRTEPYDAARFKGIRSMLVPEERRMLYWLSHHAGKEGCIVDAGAFLGGSTAHLADGILDNPNPVKRVHSFDLFEVSAYARREFDLDGIDSTLSIYTTNIARWSHRITIYPGDIMNSAWRPEPIEILFLDCLKTSAVGDWAIRNFFPSLVPGSILIQQDFIHAYLPWIHVAMGYFADHFSYLTDTRINSALYVCEREIAKEEVQGFIYADIPLPARQQLFDRAVVGFDEPAQVEILARARQRLNQDLQPLNS